MTGVSRQWSVVSCKRITTDNGQHAIHLLLFNVWGKKTQASKQSLILDKL